MAKKTEIDSYEKLYYWIDSMINAGKRTIKEREGLRKLRDFVQSRQERGWKWEDIAEWATYNTSVAGGIDPFEETR